MLDSISLLALLVGGAIGVSLPDVDLVFPFLSHRSIVTHSFFLPLFAYGLGPENKPWLKFGLAGLCLSMAVHLSFDLFPRGWIGFALIHIPLFGRLGAALSFVWLLCSLVVCLILAFALLPKQSSIWIGILVLVITFLYMAHKEPRIALQSALTLGISFVAIRRP